MTCPKCKNAMPDLALVCPGCTRKESHRVYLERQRDPLRQVIAGVVALHIRTADQIAHVQMFDMPIDWAFCGRALHPLNKHRYVEYSNWPTAAHICSACRAAVDAALAGAAS